MPSKDLTFRLFGEDVSASSSLRRLSVSADRAGKTFEQSFGMTKKVLAGVGLAAAGAAAMVLKTGIGEAMDASAGLAQLKAGLASTHNAAHVTTGGMEALASSIQNMSGQTDDSIVKSEQLLLTFTNIRNVGPNKIFDQATQASADMAAKMGGDASKNAILLGKALNDPVKGISALTRVGVSFTEAQKKQVAAMVKTGDTVGAQKLILHELNTEFGGAAKAAGQSLPGQLQRVQRAFEDVSQTVVESILPVVTPAIGKIRTAITASLPTLLGFVRGFMGLATWAAANAPLLLTIAGVVVGLVAAFKVYSGIMATVRMATAAWAVVQAVLNVVLSANPVGIVILAIGALIAIVILLVTHWKQVCAFLQTVWGAVCKWFADTIHSIAASWSHGWNQIASFARGVWNGIVGFIRAYITMVRTTITNVVRTIVAVWHAYWTMVSTTVRNVWNGIVGFIRGFINTVRDIIRNVLMGILAIWRGAWNAVIGYLRLSWNGAVAFLRDIPGKVIGVFSNAGRWLFSAGQKIVGGLIDGIRGMIGNAARAAGDVMGAIANFFPHSPAKEGPFSGRGWTPYSGQALVEGFAGGMDASISSVRRSALGVVSAASGTAELAFAATTGVTAARGGSLAAISARGGAGTAGTTVHVHVHGAVVGNQAALAKYVLGAVVEGTRQGAIPRGAFAQQ